MNLPPTFVSGSERIVNAVIETPKCSRNKFAFNETSCLFELRNILPSGTSFPPDFGFISHTKGYEGDPTEVLVIVEQSSYPGCVMQCTPIGIIKVEQTDTSLQEPKRNDRLLAVPVISKEYARLAHIRELSDNDLKSPIHFSMYYNELEGGTYRLIGTEVPEATMTAIKKAAK